MIAPWDEVVTIRTMTVQANSSFVAVVDDDDSMRSALQGLLKQAGLLLPEPRLVFVSPGED